MMEEYRVPDAMVGLSKYIYIDTRTHAHFLNHRNDACTVAHIQPNIQMSLLLSLKSLAEGENKLTKYSRILAARFR